MAPTNESMTNVGTWQERLAAVMDTMREMSRQRDAEGLVRTYARRMQEIVPADRRLSLSRRGLELPRFRITRYSGWGEYVNPWKEKERLPLVEGGLLGELIYADEPCIIDDLELDPDDPAAEYLAGQRSLMALPLLDGGVALNMVVLTREEPAAFDREALPDMVWQANLFGRATHNLVLAEQLRDAYEMVDKELKLVADIQRSLLPKKLPDIPTMKLAAHYETSQRAGGDYYDFFALPDGRYGLLIADVSGHGTPAAVMMAVTHSIAHMYPGNPNPRPSDLLKFVNHHLASRYTNDTGTFVTAFYGIYDPKERSLRYSSAGHNPPRIRHCAGSSVSSLTGARHVPLGVSLDETYTDASVWLTPGDQIVFFTDGITEAESIGGDMFGLDRLDQVLSHCRDDATDIIEAILGAVDRFTSSRPATDDRTLVVAKIL